MRTFPLQILLAVVATTMATPAWGALQLVNGSTLVSPGSPSFGQIPASNNFQANLISALSASNAADTRLVKSDIKVTQSGTITFYAHAAESGFNNSFLVNNIAVYTENSDFGWIGNPSSFYTLPVNQNDLLSNLINFSNNGALVPFTAKPGEAGFGIFATAANAVDGYTTSTLYFGYDDNGANQDDNHDDLIVRAVFTPSPVPEPASLIVWSVLASSAMGAALLRNRRRRTEQSRTSA